MRALALAPTALLVLAACGSDQKAPDVPAMPSAPTAAASAAPTPSATAAPDKYATAEAAPHDDPNEKEGPIVLEPLVKAGTPKSAFPKQTVSDSKCLEDLPFTGKHQKDYEEIIKRCGTPTGLIEYTKPAQGRLHATKDKHDDFQVKVVKGYCYRYFAVADDGIKDIDIVILRRGAIIATDQTDQPVAVINGSSLWCTDEDMDLDFRVVIDGPGAGGYQFGVWMRPK